MILGTCSDAAGFMAFEFLCIISKPSISKGIFPLQCIQTSIGQDGLSVKARFSFPIFTLTTDAQFWRSEGFCYAWKKNGSQNIKFIWSSGWEYPKPSMSMLYSQLLCLGSRKRRSSPGLHIGSGIRRQTFRAAELTHGGILTGRRLFKVQFQSSKLLSC